MYINRVLSDTQNKIGKKHRQASDGPWVHTESLRVGCRALADRLDEIRGISFPNIDKIL